MHGGFWLLSSNPGKENTQVQSVTLHIATWLINHKPGAKKECTQPRAYKSRVTTQELTACYTHHHLTGPHRHRPKATHQVHQCKAPYAWMLLWAELNNSSGSGVGAGEPRGVKLLRPARGDPRLRHQVHLGSPLHCPSPRGRRLSQSSSAPGPRAYHDFELLFATVPLQSWTENTSLELVSGQDEDKKKKRTV